MKLLQLGTNGVEEVDVAVGGGGSTAFVSTPLIAASDGQSNFVVSYTPGYTLCFLNGASFVEYTQTSGTAIVLDAAVAAKIVIGDELLVVAFNTLAIGVASDSDKLDGFDSSYFAPSSGLAAAIASINAIAALPGVRAPYISPLQVVTGGTSLSLSHGLSSPLPREFYVTLVCQVADIGYVVGQRVLLGATQVHTSATYGFLVGIDPADSSKLIYKVSSYGAYLNNVGGMGTAAPLTAASWRAEITAL